MGEDHNRQKKIALFNDFTGFGRCALTVSIPIISKLKIQAVPIPTSVFSNHTAYDSFFMTDFTDNICSYVNEWKKLGLKFEAVLCGYMANEKQFEQIKDFADSFLKDDGLFILDPVMGDNGKIYKSYQGPLAEKMKELVGHADIITPNVTEACLLSGVDYDSLMALSDVKRTDELLGISRRLHEMMGNRGTVIISGVAVKDYIGNIICDDSSSPVFMKQKKVGRERCGTGDIFASIVAAGAVNGEPASVSVKKASAFIRKCIIASDNLNIPLTDGVCFEEVLEKLR